MCGRVFIHALAWHWVGGGGKSGDRRVRGRGGAGGVLQVGGVGRGEGAGCAVGDEGARAVFRVWGAMGESSAMEMLMKGMSEYGFKTIGVKAHWRGIQGRMVLFVSNKYTRPLTAVMVVVLPPSHLRILSPPDFDTVRPRAQVQCPFNIFCLKASQKTEVLEFAYNYGNIPVSAQLKLPSLMKKFLKAIPVSTNDFVARWQALAGPRIKL